MNRPCPRPPFPHSALPYLYTGIARKLWLSCEAKSPPPASLVVKVGRAGGPCCGEGRGALVGEALSMGLGGPICC